MAPVFDFSVSAYGFQDVLPKKSFLAIVIQSLEFLEIQCAENRDAPVNGTKTDNAKGYYEFKDVIIFTCNSGYKLIGESRINCESDGTWSHAAPVCTSEWICSYVRFQFFVK